MHGKTNMETCITMCKIDRQQQFAVWLRKPKQGLCISLEGWDGEGDGREVQREGIYVYLWLIHVEVLKKNKDVNCICNNIKGDETDVKSRVSVDD